MKVVIKDHLDISPDSIAAKMGDRVTIVKYDSRPEWKGWIQCLLGNGKVGWISASYLELQGDKAILNKNYDAREIDVRIGESIEVIKEDNGWSWIRRTDGKEGWVPSQCY